MRLSIILLCTVAIVLSEECYSQSTDTTSFVQNNKLRAIENIPSRSLDYVDRKYSKLTNDIETQSSKLLIRMQQKEIKLQQKLQNVDSGKAKEIFVNTQSKYEKLKSKIKSPIDKAVSNPLTEYIPGVDSLSTMMKFLSQPNFSSISGDKLEQIQGVNEQVQELQGRLQQANEIQNFIRDRESQLKTALANTGLGTELLGINKEVYYYQEKLQEYKGLLDDRKKLEEKLFATVRYLPSFQNFMRKNSYLALLFRMPDDPSVIAGQPIPGLQTRASVQNLLNQRLVGVNTIASGSPQQVMTQQLQQAQSQINNLKDKLNKLGGGNSDMTMPDFKPNNQRTKTFFQRLEYGFNIQSQRGTSFLPATTDFALTVGYKLSESKTLGVGASYKMGWGHGFDDIHFSSEGVGLRSYGDFKLRGSIWMTSGFEFNYFQSFNSLDDIKKIDTWQRSALAGLIKKYKVGKFNGNIQVLYDFLAYKQVPEAQPLKFRVGYNF